MCSESAKPAKGNTPFARYTCHHNPKVALDHAIEFIKKHKKKKQASSETNDSSNDEFDVQYLELPQPSINFLELPKPVKKQSQKFAVITLLRLCRELPDKDIKSSKEYEHIINGRPIVKCLFSNLDEDYDVPFKRLTAKILELLPLDKKFYAKYLSVKIACNNAHLVKLEATNVCYELTQSGQDYANDL